LPTFAHALADQPDTGFWLYGPEVFRAYWAIHDDGDGGPSLHAVEAIRHRRLRLRLRSPGG
jgi:hypothetical protein